METLFAGVSVLAALYIVWEEDRAVFLQSIFIALSIAGAYLIIETGFAYLFVMYLDDKYPLIRYVEIDDDEETAAASPKEAEY